MVQALKDHKYPEALRAAETGTVRCGMMSVLPHNPMLPLTLCAACLSPYMCAVKSLDPGNARVQQFIPLLEEKIRLGEGGWHLNH